MMHASEKDRITHAAVLLPLLKPLNATEALLLGQFLSFQESGMKSLHQANQQQMFIMKKDY
jgi:hypothetical protein